ncbi:hypothetical protein DSM3645_02578 [Blastopirellula marina DSM 3645]|uniref:Uncharacterized protein n=1 Tax=Blastopirellula marina DSM 3645 TaxID=314230 RepID=A3ZVH9_9BACT|nr:hypothetical protein DSM3645_02578 [Blastopirellula marina DSM 3645]
MARSPFSRVDQSDEESGTNLVA